MKTPPLPALFLSLMVLVGSVHRANAGGETAPAHPARPVVVLVHGCWNNGRIFDPMVQSLEREGCTCFAPDLTPNDGRLGIRQLTEELSGKIDARFGPGAPVVLVGFSMGGLVARDYVEHVAAAPRRVRGVFLISSGGEGTLWANLSPRSGQRDMAVGSAFLHTLNADEAPWKTIPLHAYWTPLDLMIVPAVNSRWPGGNSTCVWCPAHPWMPRSRKVIADIAARLRTLAPAGGSCRLGARRRAPSFSRRDARTRSGRGGSEPRPGAGTRLFQPIVRSDPKQTGWFRCFHPVNLLPA